MKTLYLIRGVSGSGKSTLAADFLECGLVSYVFEADDYFMTDGGYKFNPKELWAAHNSCQVRTKHWLGNGFSVAVSNTSTTEKEVEAYRKIAEETGAKFVSIVVESRHNGKNQHGVPAEKVQQMRDRFSIKL